MADPPQVDPSKAKPVNNARLDGACLILRTAFTGRARYGTRSRGCLTGDIDRDTTKDGLEVDRASGGPVLVVEDDEACRALIVALLDRIGCTVQEAASGDEALSLAKANRPALVLLDVSIPGISGYEVCHELRATYGHALPVVFVSGNRIDTQDRIAGLLIGADDYIVKPFNSDELIARVRRLLMRNAVDDPRLERRRSPAPIWSLTPREREVLVLLARGRGQAEIATELVISSKTVATHIQRVLAKLGVHSRAHAVVIAHRERLVGDTDTHAVPTAVA
jgi:DNA-binding NarL/FixJ family response regulator